MKILNSIIPGGAVLGLLFSTQLLSAAGGSLTPPPGPPGPTMKSLDEIEPRIPISSLPFNIASPGSYYLTTNLSSVAGQHGITITANEVSLDLMGYELVGVAGSLSGIYLNPANALHIHNGVIRYWGQDGINGTNGGTALLEDLRVANNSRWGISINSGSQVRKCISFSNGDVGIITSNGVEVDDCVSGLNGTHGIQAGTGSNIRRCLSTGNSASGITGSGLDGLNIIECNADGNLGAGIATLGQTIVKDCFARTNAQYGIIVGPGSVVSGCNASDNKNGDGINAGDGSTITACTTRDNNGDGIQTGQGATVSDSTCRDNLGDAIQVKGDCNVKNNTCDNSGPGLAAVGAGVHVVVGGDTRIENNNLTDGDVGLWIETANNIVLNNTVRNNATNYNIVNGNQLNIFLCQIPQNIEWPATVKLAGTLTGQRNTNGITILSDDVTIDLNDHSLIGVPLALDGINVNGAHTNITIRNGSVHGWPGDGVDAGSAVNSQFRNLSLSRNTGNGLRTGEGSLVIACNARTNTQDGISIGNGCRIVDCSTSRNGSEGIFTGVSCTVEGCIAFENTANGIFTGGGTSVQNCSAYSNGTNGIAMLNPFFPLGSTHGGQVVGCTVRFNTGNGIQVGSRCVVERNNCSQNTVDGVLISGVDNRIDGNNCTGGQRGVHAVGTGNLIVRNSVSGFSVDDYTIAVGNKDAQVLAPGAAFVATNPWANFSF